MRGCHAHGADKFYKNFCSKAQVLSLTINSDSCSRSFMFQKMSTRYPSLGNCSLSNTHFSSKHGILQQTRLIHFATQDTQVLFLTTGPGALGGTSHCLIWTIKKMGIQGLRAKKINLYCFIKEGYR